jgi:hypothetical protein
MADDGRAIMVTSTNRCPSGLHVSGSRDYFFGCLERRRDGSGCMESSRSSCQRYTHPGADLLVPSARRVQLPADDDYASLQMASVVG